MQIDWFTFSAQIVNFIILMLLLKKLLFDRIVKAMDQREEKIASQLKEAERREADAENERKKYESKISENDEQREQRLDEAREEAEKERKKMRNEAREEVDSLRDEWRRSVESEKEHFIKDLRRQTGRQIYQVTRKMLSDMADKNMEEQIIAVFMKRMKKLPDEERKEIIKALGNNSFATCVSSFQIDSGQRSQITRTLNDILGSKMDVEYKESENIICGIEFQTEDRVISWTLDHYLDQIEKNMLEMLGEEQTE